MDDGSITGPDAELTRDLWMHNGGFSNYAPLLERWTTYHITDAEGRLESVHTFKVDSFVHYLDTMGSCSCGPHVLVYANPVFGPVSHVSHNEWDAPEVGIDEDDEWGYVGDD